MGRWSDGGVAREWFGLFFGTGVLGFGFGSGLASGSVALKLMIEGRKTGSLSDLDIESKDPPDSYRTYRNILDPSSTTLT